MASENKALIFNFSKFQNFYNQILQAIAILDKTLKIFIFQLFNFNSSFFFNILHFNVPLGRGRPAIPNLLIFLKNIKKALMV